MTDELKLKLELRLKQYQGIEIGMLEALQGKVLYIHEGDTSTPFSGTLDAFGENFLRFTDVKTYQRHFRLGELKSMREATEREIAGKIPVVYKNKKDIATLVELDQEKKE